jgi:hypothetical protein
MRKLIIATALLLFIFPAGARAQSDVSLATAIVSIWPEYDRPTALVITQMLLSPDTALPAEVVLRVPSSVEKIHTVAIGSDLASVADQGVDYTVEEDGEWSEIKITAPDRAIRVEYYDASLVKEDTTRTYTYTWPGDYAVDSFSFTLRAPLESTNVTSQPPLTQDAVDRDGFEYWTAQAGSLGQGEQYQATISYERTTDLPSTAILLDNQPGAVTPTSSWTSFVYDIVPYVIGVLGLALLIGGGWWFWRSGRVSVRGSARRRHAQHASATIDDDGDQEVYCHNCGRRAGPTDRFCRACGTRLRQTES